MRRLARLLFEGAQDVYRFGQVRHVEHAELACLVDPYLSHTGQLQLYGATPKPSFAEGCSGSTAPLAVVRYGQAVRSPRYRTLVAECPASRPIIRKHREPDGSGSALFDRSHATVLIHVRCGKTWIRRIDLNT